MNCPCGTLKEYTDCCEIAHKNIFAVTTAEQLMRSRYTAFTMGNGDYLMKSHHSSTRPIKEKKEIENWAKSVTWIRLEIIEVIKGNNADEKGTVAFNAYYYENSKVEIINEKSAFVKENDCWFYLGLSN
tara:strand:- start:23381 stop:23767 length:387 start_codon:yes stop_codon:yes gene_type:complete